jgi:hypothetical protein
MLAVVMLLMIGVDWPQNIRPVIGLIGVNRNLKDGLLKEPYKIPQTTDSLTGAYFMDAVKKPFKSSFRTPPSIHNYNDQCQSSPHLILPFFFEAFQQLKYAKRNT